MIVFRDTRGSSHPASKLTEAQAIHIAHCVRNGVPRENLAALFGVSASTVNGIAQKRNWKHLEAT